MVLAAADAGCSVAVFAVPVGLHISGYHILLSRLSHQQVGLTAQLNDTTS